MHQALRVSRIRAPRGTLTTAILLAVVFIAFGLAISALTPDHATAAPVPMERTALTFSNWLLSL
ncbi:MAG: hypothetical protein RIC56_14290 [Pseudomonadales bacterium]